MIRELKLGKKGLFRRKEQKKKTNIGSGVNKKTVRKIGQHRGDGIGRQS